MYTSNEDGLLFLIVSGVMTCCCPPLSECLLERCRAGLLVICALKERAPLDPGGVPLEGCMHMPYVLSVVFDWFIVCVVFDCTVTRLHTFVSPPLFCGIGLKGCNFL